MTLHGRFRGAYVTLLLIFLGSCRHGTGTSAPSPSAPSPSAPDAALSTGGAVGKPLKEKAANTTVLSADGNLQITGLTDRVRHLHGGPPAWLSEARFEVENHSSVSRTVSVARADFIRRHPCADAGLERRTELKPSGVVIERQGNFVAAPPRIIIGAGKTVLLNVAFPAVEAYQFYCDYFSFAVTFLLDGKEPLTAEATTSVTRVTPLKR